MMQCYGFPKNVICENEAGCFHSPYWCSDCNQKRMEAITQQLTGMVKTFDRKAE